MRRPSDIGRRARLDLTFDTHAGTTRLTYAYAEPPFRIGRTFALDDAAFVIIVCSGPGVFGGDCLDLTVRVGRGARVVLTSQAALQAHPCPQPSPARISQRFDIEEDGELHCHWDPLIPFAGARVEQRFAIHAAAGARLFWSDALMAGRVKRGEVWQFAELEHELQVERAGVPVYLERYRVVPGERAVARSWAAGRVTHLSTAVIAHPDATSDAAESLHRVLCGLGVVGAAVDRTEAGLIVGRIAASSGPEFAAARVELRDSALRRIFARPHLALRK